jgi:GH43 family beta-xylosidase
MKRILSGLHIFIFLQCALFGCGSENKFRNPLLDSGADPWSIYKDGYYYYTSTYQNRLVIWKTKNLAALKTAEKKVIWEPPPGTPYSDDIWAPELHYLRGSWYMYFAADDGRNETHRIYVLKNPSADPFKETWEFKGKVTDDSDRWAIDGSVFEHDGQLYMIWSGWEGVTDGRQNIYIAKMKDPWTIDGSRVKISTPTYPWEKHGDVERTDTIDVVEVNEGPQMLKHGDHLFIVYSASGCWTEAYSLGMLRASATDNLLDPAAWKKSREPVFTHSPADSVFAPGHNSFFRSPDGTEDWILYHANSKPGQGCGNKRSPRAQKFTWNEDGTPYFGKPVSTKIDLDQPSEN